MPRDEKESKRFTRPPSRRWLWSGSSWSWSFGLLSLFTIHRSKLKL